MLGEYYLRNRYLLTAAWRAVNSRYSVNPWLLAILKHPHFPVSCAEYFRESICGFWLGHNYDPK